MQARGTDKPAPGIDKRVPGWYNGSTANPLQKEVSP